MRTTKDVFKGSPQDTGTSWGQFDGKFLLSCNIFYIIWEVVNSNRNNNLRSPQGTYRGHFLGFVSKHHVQRVIKFKSIN